MHSFIILGMYIRRNEPFPCQAKVVLPYSCETQCIFFKTAIRSQHVTTIYCTPYIWVFHAEEIYCAGQRKQTKCSLNKLSALFPSKPEPSSNPNLRMQKA
jgi:hypothetical protein